MHKNNVIYTRKQKGLYQNKLRFLLFNCQMVVCFPLN